MAQCISLNMIGAATFSAGIPTGPANIPIGTTSVTFTVLVTNTGTVSGTANVTMYEVVSKYRSITKGTSIIAPGGTETVSFVFNPSTWAVGTYSVCSIIGP